MTILDLLMSFGLAPKRAAATNGGEYASPCPRCGGKDRFRSWPQTDRWMCRGCNLSGDMIGFLREYQDKSCPDAHEHLGLACTSTTCTVLDICRVGKAGAGAGRKRRPQPVQPKAETSRTSWQPTTADTPADLWQQKAQKLVDRAHEQLLANEDQLQYLAGRGLPLEAVKRYKLGYVPEDFWRQRESWGLPTELKNGRPKKLWIPQGIVIPFIKNDQVHRIRIRLSNPIGDLRYYWVPGSGNDTFLLGADRKAIVAVESDLDGLMIHHHAGDLVGVVCVGNTTAKPKREAADILRSALHILVALDSGDEQDARGQRPGAVASKWWLETFEEAERWPVPNGGDPGEAFEAGVDIRQWIIEGLPPVFHVPESAKPAPRPQEKKPEPPKQAADQVVRGTSKSGFPYAIVSDRKQKQQIEATEEDVAVFLPSEINRLKGLDRDVAEVHIHAKALMPGAEIVGRRDVKAG